MLTANRVAELLLLIGVRFGPTVGQGTDETSLALADALDGLLQRGTFLPGAVAGPVRDPSGFECGFEVGAPVGSEDVCGEEAGDGCDQDLFPDPQALGMVTEPWPVPVFVRVDLAGVVRDLVAVLAEHAAAADLADDVRPQDVGTPGGRVGVGPVGRP
ncbi:hypothetical protein [Streptomyces lonegramiae]|uniref:Secreted protein n=1 Tax=Streptomyces lonegramiae TaxID=3075524 RepID=A0ABU2XT28_9ACTN|nr:hypothetical protein [Streptomyces sp. DSM 41529]MDT0548215.1 hypothetical protein [Streptomyces sp. DSM 41529]